MNKKTKEAQELFRNYRLDEAREILEEVISGEPNNIEALVTLGKIHSRTQDYGKSMNYYQQVISIQPENIEATTGISLIKNILHLTNNYYFENAYTDDDLYDFEQ